MPTFIKPCHGYLNSFYGPRVNPVTGDRGAFHRGIDYTGADDNSIFAAAAGKIRFLDNSATRTGFGRYIIITHDNGYETVYAHLSSIKVKQGQRVKQGQVIGIKGTTGNSTGMHLHFEMSKGRWVNTYANNVDPLPFISDPEIKKVQEVLKEQRLYKGAIDGIHGNSSIAALKIFQKNNGLGADGVPGRTTMAAVEKAKAKIEAKDWLEVGDRGPEVGALQRYLNQVGIPTTVDEHFSANTRAGVLKFQEARKLKADGIYGKGSVAEMNKALKEGFTILKPEVKPATPVNKPKEEFNIMDIFKPSTTEGKNALLTVLKRFEKKEQPLADSWRKKALEGEFTMNDGMEVMFVAIERGYITGKVETAALLDKTNKLEKEVESLNI